MPTIDPRIDRYIERARPFAQPILRHLRDTVHRACPDVVETFKWSHPSFLYGDGILCSMAAFNEHATFGFWKHSLIEGIPRGVEDTGMGQFGRLATVKDLPSSRDLRRFIHRAMELNRDGTRVPRPKRKPKPPAVVPADLARALKHNAKARAAFEAFPPSHQREYIEWITEAKTAATRQRRLATAVEWIALGRRRHWKYQP